MEEEHQPKVQLHLSASSGSWETFEEREGSTKVGVNFLVPDRYKRKI